MQDRDFTRERADECPYRSGDDKEKRKVGRLRFPSPLVFLVLTMNLPGKSIINLCMSHTSRDKVATAVQSAMQEKVAAGPDDRTSGGPGSISHVSISQLD